MKDSNEPAFPLHSPYRTNGGMTTRQWMCGMVASGAIGCVNGSYPEHEMASKIVSMADAILDHEAKTRKDNQ